MASGSGKERRENDWEELRGREEEAGMGNRQGDVEAQQGGTGLGRCPLHRSLLPWGFEE